MGKLNSDSKSIATITKDELTLIIISSTHTPK